jgi:DNA repair ATPase RecN
MTREEELLEHIEEQKKYIKLLEEQNEALQKKTGDAVKELDQFRQNEQKKLDDALNDIDKPLSDKPYLKWKKKPFNMYAAAEKESDDEDMSVKPTKTAKATMTDEELLDQLDGIDFDEKAV